jgi:hypothetical protein
MVKEGRELLLGDSVVVRGVVHVEDEVDLLVEGSSAQRLMSRERGGHRGRERRGEGPGTDRETSDKLVKVNQTIAFDIKLTEEPICGEARAESAKYEDQARSTSKQATKREVLQKGVFVNPFRLILLGQILSLVRRVDLLDSVAPSRSL